MKKTLPILLLSFSILFSSLFISCATTLRVNVMRPATLDLNGAKTIAVLPFEKGEISPFDYIFDYDAKEGLDYFSYIGFLQKNEERLLNYLHTSLKKELSKSPYISLVDELPVITALDYGTEVPSDVFITGEVISFKVHDLLTKEKKEIKEDESGVIESTPAVGNGEAPNTDKTKPQVYYNFFYTREVQFYFNYKIMDGKTKKLIGYDTVKIEQMSDTVDDKSKLPDVYSMIVYEIDYFVDNLMKNIQPYNEVKAITLLEDKTKNERMKEADKLAKDGNYKESYKLYKAIYDENKTFEAGYNASLLLMAMKDLKGAESLMSELYEAFGSSEALKGLNDIRYEIKQAQRLSNQLNERK